MKKEKVVMFRNLMMAVAAAAMSLGLSGAAKATTVDVELQLLIDVSGSVDNNEFLLQRGGYVNAFNDAAVQAAILSTDNNRLGKIAAEVIYWSSAASQAVAVGWTLLDSVSAIETFAASIEAAARTSSGLTAIGSAIEFGAARFAGNGYDGTTKIIDVSGDGTLNDGVSLVTAHAAATAAGITRINGLAIGTSSLLDYYRDNVIFGDKAFALQANDFLAFDSAIKRKLTAEITGTNPNVIPLPAGAWLLLTGIGGMAALRRRKKAA